MSEVASSGVVAHDLGHYLRPLRRHTRLLAAFILIGVLLGAIGYAVLRQTYSAATKVYVATPTTAQSQAGTQARTSGVVDPDTEAQIVKSTTVADIARTALKTSTPVGTLIGRVTVTVPANSQILRIVYTAHSLKVAKAGSLAFAEAYLNNRQSTEQGAINAQLTLINRQLATATADLNRQRRVQRVTGNGSPQRKGAKSQAVIDQTTIASLTSQATTLHSTAVIAGNVLSAPASAGAGSPIREIVALAGIVMGLLAGLLAVFARERFDSTVRYGDDLARVGIGLIAEVPAPVSGRRAQDPRNRRKDAAARTRVDQRTATAVAQALGDEGGSIYVASVSEAQTDHDLAQRLVKELGRFGSTVTVVRPALTAGAHQRRALLPGAGTTTSGPLGWPGGTPQPSTVLPPGESRYDEPATPDVQGAMRMVEDALRRARYVVIEGSRAAVDSEAYILASLSQVSVLIVEPGVTTRDDLAEAAEQIRVTSSELLGAVLWRPAADGSSDSVSREPREEPPSAPMTTGYMPRNGQSGLAPSTVVRLGIAAVPDEDDGPRSADARH